MLQITVAELDRNPEKYYYAYLDEDMNEVISATARRDSGEYAVYSTEEYLEYDERDERYVQVRNDRAAILSGETPVYTELKPVFVDAEPEPHTPEPHTPELAKRFADGAAAIRKSE